MSLTSTIDEPVVDVAFALEGRSLARDHSQALADALAARLPWLAGHPTAGIHAVKVVPGSGPQGWLSQRARLLLRVPQSREAELATLAGCTIGVAGSELRLGAPTPHRLLPHGTLYAHFVAARSDDEGEFMRDAQAELEALRIDAHTVCGKRQQRRSDAGVIVGFSLMLHGLGATDSLTVQRIGIGPHRALGCGLFVPHKSAAAVGA